MPFVAGDGIEEISDRRVIRAVTDQNQMKDSCRVVEEGRDLVPSQVEVSEVLVSQYEC